MLLTQVQAAAGGAAAAPPGAHLPAVPPSPSLNERRSSRNVTAAASSALPALKMCGWRGRGR